MRRCKYCELDREEEEFYPRLGGLKRLECKYCNLRKQRHYLYGISEEDFQKLRLKAAGKCMLCNDNTKKLNIDHCHKTGKVRGLLCTRCNSLLGVIEKDPLMFNKIQEYLA